MPGGALEAAKYQQEGLVQHMQLTTMTALLRADGPFCHCTGTCKRGRAPVYTGTGILKSVAWVLLR